MSAKIKYRCLALFDIVLRFYDKLKIVHDGFPLESGPLRFDPNIHLDNIYAFFIFCYHFKDWIGNEDLIDEKTKKSAENFVTNRPCLRYCADIANGIKHLKLKNPRSKSRPQFEQYKRSIFSKEQSAKSGSIQSENISARLYARDEYIIKTDSGSIEIFDLATECVNTWKDFINKKIIIDKIADRIESKN